jgi:hypothetical protein
MFTAFWSLFLLLKCFYVTLAISSQVKEKIFSIVSSAYKELLQVPLTCSELWHSSNTMDPFTVSSYGELFEFDRTTNGRSFLQGKHLTKDNMVDFYCLMNWH